MIFLVLAYGSENDWNQLSHEEQKSLLTQDEVLRNRGSLVAAVTPTVTTVRAWDGIPATTTQPFAPLSAPLAWFGVIEARDLAHAVQLVAKTPCARAKGAVELRRMIQLNHGAPVVA